MKMKILNIVLFVIGTSLTQASELIIDWALDLRNPDLYLSPPLSLKCLRNKSVYFVQGSSEPGDNPSIYRYKLPSEISGKCILSLGGGMGPNWPEGNNLIEIKDPNAVVRTRMPGTSASFVFTLSKELKSHCLLQIFKLSKDGLPLPEWAYITDFSSTPSNSIITRRFTIVYAEAGEYVAYVVESEHAEELRYLYAKKFSVAKGDLVTHDQNVTIDDLHRASQELKTQVEFTPDDEFTGVAAVALVNNFEMRSVRVAKDGKIVTP